MENRHRPISLTLNEARDWSYNGGGVPTHSQFLDVLGNVASLLIPGDFSCTPSESVSLDNVRLTSSSVLSGDVNNDGVVNLLDVAPFVALLTSGGFQVEADINGDGVVSVRWQVVSTDLSTLCDASNHRTDPCHADQCEKTTLLSPGCGEVHVLITSLLDSTKYPAMDLIDLYHVRWEEEIAFSEWKVAMCQGTMLRSQSPEMVRQEIGGMLLSHWIVRTLIFRGAEQAGVEPIAISFTGALDILHARLPEAKKSRPMTKKWLADLIGEIGREQLPPRACRINPRKLKKRSKAWPTKRDSDRNPPKPSGPFVDQIEMSI